MALIAVAKEGMLPQTQDEIRTILRLDRHVTGNKPDNFSMSTAQQMVEQFRQITAMTFLVMIVLSSIGLLVGGIGVMNIMLVTVAKRTREIGMRKAIGAKRSDIMGQFIVEAVLLSAIGGLIGVAVGLIGSHFKVVGIQPEVADYSVFLAFGVAVVTGLFFGLYPASRAARLLPIEALRYE